MAHDTNFPANDSFLADLPAGLREEIRALIEDMLVNALKLHGLEPGNGQGQIPISNGTQCTGLNAEKVGGNLPAAFASSAHGHSTATGSSDGFMSNTDKSKLDGIATGAEVNKPAFSFVQVGDKLIQADSKTDTLEIIPGDNIALVADETNDRITIKVTGKVPSAGSADYATTAGSAPANGGYAAGCFAEYISGGAQLPNYYGSNKLRLSMLDIPSWGWSDCLWMSSYAGGDVKGSNQLVFSKNGEHVGFRLQNYDSTTWGTLREIIHSGNIGYQSVSYANFLTPISGSASYKLGYTADGQRTNAGEWGRVVMRYDGNGQTYGVRCDRADAADSATKLTGVADVCGYSASGQGVSYTSTGGPQVMGQNGGAAMLSFHRPGAYAINFGLDTDNQLAMGGWSYGQARRLIAFQDQLTGSTAFDAGHSFGWNGYQVLSNGLILQWGVTPTYVTAYGLTVTYPVQFPSYCFCVNITPTEGASYMGLASQGVAFGVTNVNRTNFFINYAAAAENRYAYWFAIGC